MTGESVIQVRRAYAGVADAYGDATLVESGRTEYVAPVWPRTASESTEPGRSASIVGLTLALPRETSIGRFDQFIVRGDVYEVDGAAADYRSPWSATFGGVVVNLTRVGG